MGRIFITPRVHTAGVWAVNFLSFHLVEKVFIFPSLLKDNDFAGYKNPRLMVFFFQHVK